ncbi:unnamed protein product [Pylaiella littoralis]
MPTTAESDRMQDGPCSNLFRDEAKPRLLTPRPSPASAEAAPAGARSDALAQQSEPIDVGTEEWQQDSKASGLDVLVGAVDIQLRAKRAGPAAPQAAGATGAVETDERPTGATASARCFHSDSASAGCGTACMPAVLQPTSSSSSPSPMEVERDAHERSPRAGPSDGRGASRGRREGPDAFRGDNMEASACRALRTLPRSFVDHTLSPESTPAVTGGGAGSVAMPGFSMMTGAAAGWVMPARSSRRSLRPRPPLLGPPERDAYAETALAVAAARTGTPVASPGLTKKPNPRGNGVQTTAGKAREAGVKKAAPAAAKAKAAKAAKEAKEAKALKAFRASKAKTVTAQAAKAKAAKAKAVEAKAVKAKTGAKAKPGNTKAVKAKKATVKKKGGKRRKVIRRRGPAGQSHFKGVCITPAGTWRAVIYVERRQKYLGVFDSEFDAARAYDAAAILHFPGQTPLLNNPDVVERQLNELSASNGKPFATAGAPELPESNPPPPPPPPPPSPGFARGLAR